MGDEYKKQKNWNEIFYAYWISLFRAINERAYYLRTTAILINWSSIQPLTYDFHCNPAAQYDLKIKLKSKQNTHPTRKHDLSIVIDGIDQKNW